MEQLQIAGEVLERLHDHAGRNQVVLHLDGCPVVIIRTRQMLDEIIYNLCDHDIRIPKAEQERNWVCPL